MRNTGPTPCLNALWEMTPSQTVMCVVSIRMRVLSLHTGKAVSRAWIRVDLWLPALPTASPWTTARGSWTPRRRPTAWRPTWWTAPQVTLAAWGFWEQPRLSLFSSQANSTECTRASQAIGPFGEKGKILLFCFLETCSVQLFENLRVTLRFM